MTILSTRESSVPRLAAAAAVTVLVCSAASPSLSGPAVRINEFMAINSLCCFNRFTEADDWVEIHNYGTAVVDIGGMYLTDDLSNPTKSRISDANPRHTRIRGGEFKVLWLEGEFDDPRHPISFALDGEGEQIGLFAADGHTAIDTLTFGPQFADVSYGRVPRTGRWAFFADPTPGSANRTAPATGPVEAPVVSPEAGFYEGSLRVSVSTPHPGARTYFTLDGSDPREADSLLFTDRIRIDAPTIFRARAFAEGFIPSPIITRSYFLNESFALATLSLVTNPPNLWDWETGIYVEGPRVKPGDEHPYYNANYWRSWSRPAHIEFFDEERTRGFGTEAMLEIAGHKQTRPTPKKTFGLQMRSIHGKSQLRYPLFPDKPVDRFGRLILRGGGDWTRLKNEFVYQINSHMNSTVDMQAYRPVVLILNGEYWGIYNLMENKGVQFVENHFGTADIDMLEGNGRPREGDAQHYETLLDFLNTQDIRTAESLSHLETLIDTGNFIDYCIYLIYTGREHNEANIRYWRPRTPSGRWRWIAFDFDSWARPDTPTLKELASDRTAADWRLLGRLLENAAFRNAFINRFADFLNTALAPESSGQVIAGISEAIRAEMPDELERWEELYGRQTDQWEEEVEALTAFTRDRPGILRQHLMTEFGLDGQAALSVDVQPAAAGKIRVSTVVVDSFPWAGSYFQGVPVELSALPEAGYAFSAWSPPTETPDPSISLLLGEALDITARFVPTTDGSPVVIINEINYHSADHANTEDWVEILNVTERSVDLSNWHCKDGDDDHDFVIPENTVVPAGGYLVLCQDLSGFRSRFPDVGNAVGDLGFGISRRGEAVRLFDSSGNLVDQVSFKPHAPWPEEPDGTGATLALKDPGLDNSLPESWSASTGYGSPGAPNFDSVTHVSHSPGGTPAEFRLDQNFPNPFNHTTTIVFSLPRAMEVRVSVHGVSGQKIADLSHGHREAGSHSVEFDGTGMATGIYFYRVATERFRATRKMVLLR